MSTNKKPQTARRGVSRLNQTLEIYQLESDAPHCVLPPNFFDRLLAKHRGPMRANTDYLIAKAQQLGRGDVYYD